MVREVKDKEKTLYTCEACGLAYEEREWVEKCQELCQEQQSCNIEIMGYAVPVEPETDL